MHPSPSQTASSSTRQLSSSQLERDDTHVRRGHGLLPLLTGETLTPWSCLWDWSWAAEDFCHTEGSPGRWPLKREQTQRCREKGADTGRGILQQPASLWLSLQQRGFLRLPRDKWQQKGKYHFKQRLIIFMASANFFSP